MYILLSPSFWYQLYPENNMKDNKSIIHGAPSTSSTRIQNLDMIRAGLIRKRATQHIILERLREYLLYSKLRSLLPPQQQPPSTSDHEDHEPHEVATELELEPYEFPEGDCRKQHEDDHNINGGGNESEEEDGAETSKPFVPSIKLKRTEASILITTVVLKDVSLTSALFGLLEEEKLDIVFENQYRTETKVAHTIQVKVQPGYNVDALEQRLCTWATKRI